LEIGCGNGDTAAYALITGKCGSAVGVELCPAPAAEAATKLTEVIVGDIETLRLPYRAAYFDVLIMSEVLEHLRNPEAVLRTLHRLMRPNAIVLAGSPNVSHRSVIAMLLRGRWDYQPTGIMDTTHLRWFTPLTYRRLFECTGYIVDTVGPARTLNAKARAVNWVTMGKFEYLLHSQIYIKARRT
jgi:SAM-dependent methyltransferase